MKVYLIRHAKSKDSVKGIHQRDATPLADKNSVDKSLLAHLQPEKVYSSPLPRARQTADILFGDYEVIDYLHEFRWPHVLYGKPREEGHVFWEQHMPAVRRDPDWRFDGSESFRDAVIRATRFQAFLKSLPYKTVAVVGHGTFFRHFLGVVTYGTRYTFDMYEHKTGLIDWANLEVREVEL